MRTSNRFPMSGCDDVGQHVNLNNMPGPKKSKRDKMYVLGNYGIGLYMHKRKEYN